jgi:translation initiation factor IF-2
MQNQLELRREEARKQAELIARQAEEVRQKRERKKTETAEIVKKNDEQQELISDEAPLSTEPVSAISTESNKETLGELTKTPEPAEQPVESQSSGNSTEGTLHKPAIKPDDKADKKKKQAKQQVVWKDESTKKRSVKTRGDLANSTQGWRTRRDKHSKPVHMEDQNAHAFSAPTEPIVREIMVPETISVSALAQKMSVKAADVIKVLMKMGSMVTINQMLDQDTAMIVVEEMGHIAKYAEMDNPETFLADSETSATEAELFHVRLW